MQILPIALVAVLAGSADFDALLKHIFHGPGPVVVLGDTSTPRLEWTTVETLPSGTVRVCYWRKGESQPHACIA